MENEQNLNTPDTNLEQNQMPMDQPMENTGQQSQGPSNDEITMATISHIGGLLTGFIVPLVIWIVQKDRSNFSVEHAKEALNFQITLMIGGIVSIILSIVVVGLLLGFLLFLADVVFCIMAAMEANKGHEYRYPWSIRIIK